MQERGSDTDSWWGNFKTATKMLFEWDLGIGPANRTFKNDRVANAFRNAWKVNETRDYWYKKANSGRDMVNSPVTGYPGKFGLLGLFKAGVDPIEQFVGGYDIYIHVKNKNMLEFTLKNTTSVRSLLYGFGPHWKRSTFRLDGDAEQTYIFTEPIDYRRLKR